MDVPFLDLTRTYDMIEPEVTSAVGELLRSQRMILGRAVHRFEQSLAALCGSMFAVGCASGTDALVLAQLALGIGPGDEVITTPFSFVASAGSIQRVGAKPVFVDIDPRTFNLDTGLIASALTERTKAVVPVHLFGQPADMDGLLDLARERGLAVIEDAAQAIGAAYHNRFCGALGMIGCLSFYPTKNLGAAGDAGACVTDDESLAEELCSLRVHGAVPDKPYFHRHVGLNSRIDAIQAVYLSVKMKHLRKWTEARQEIARYYTDRLADVEGMKTPHVASGREHVFHQYVIRTARRDELKNHLADRGVQTQVYYPMPLHLQECFTWLGRKGGDFPEAERASREVLALPIYPGLTREEQDHVIQSVLMFFMGG